MQGREEESEINDLSTPSVLSAERGFQIILNLPRSIERHLDEKESTNYLVELGEVYLYHVLREAQELELAGRSSAELNVSITARHLAQAAALVQRRGVKRAGAWGYVRNISLALLGASLSCFPFYPLSAGTAALLVSWLFFYANKET